MYWLTYDLCFPSSAHSLSYFINSSCFGFYSGKFRRSFSSCDTLSLMKPFLVWFPQPTRKLCWGNIYHFQCFPDSVFLVCPAPTRNICCEAKQCFRNIFLPHATNSGACICAQTGNMQKMKHCCNGLSFMQAFETKIAFQMWEALTETFLWAALKSNPGWREYSFFVHLLNEPQ